MAVIGVEALDAVTADRHLGVRPAFCLGKDTVMQKSDSVVEGKAYIYLSWNLNDLGLHNVTINKIHWDHADKHHRQGDS